VRSKRRGGGGGGTNLGGLPLALPPEFVVPLALLVIVVIDEGARLGVVVIVIIVVVIVFVIISIGVTAGFAGDGCVGRVNGVVVVVVVVLLQLIPPAGSRPDPLEGRCSSRYSQDEATTTATGG